MTELRPLRLHDLPFVYRLAGHGVSFDVQLSLEAGDDGLRHVIAGRAGRVQAYVLRPPSGSGGLGQLRFLDEQQQARLAYLAPSLEEGASEELWLSLLDGLAQVAGQRGVVSIIAEVEKHASAFPILRRAGYAVYAQQNLWRRVPASLPATSVALRPATPADLVAVTGLHSQIVPALIKHIEPSPVEADECYIADSPHGLRGLVAAYESGLAVLIELYLAPREVREARALLEAALAAVRADVHPVYYRVRDYMGCSEQALRDAGFEHVAEQVVMVRHTAVRVVHPKYKLPSKVDAGAPLPTSNVEMNK